MKAKQNLFSARLTIAGTYIYFFGINFNVCNMQKEIWQIPKCG